MAKTCPGAGGGLDGGLTAGCGCRSGEPTPAEVLPCAERSLSCVDTLPYELWLRSRSLGSRFIDAIVAQGPSGAQGGKRGSARDGQQAQHLCGAGAGGAAEAPSFASERSFAKLVTDFGEIHKKRSSWAPRAAAHAMRHIRIEPSLAVSVRTVYRETCAGNSCTDHVHVCSAAPPGCPMCVLAAWGQDSHDAHPPRSLAFVLHCPI